MARWSLDLEKYAQKKSVQIRDIRAAYVFNLYASIAKKTPVDTGRALGNWDVSVGSPAEGVSDRKTQKYTQKEQLPEAEADESFFISNNLPYITKLEYGGYPNPPKGGKGKTVNGFSKRAPKGMVGVTLANNDALLEAAVRECRD